MEGNAIWNAQRRSSVPESDEQCLSEYREFCKAYLDDIAIFSCDWDTHRKHLDAVLSKLTELKFTVNVKKCVFAKTQIKWSFYRRRKR
ncbi:hypothetical protein AVEN_92005-1 [Araneus ventricosus]|uniref:Reverse transcriptase domain-containing protein n=1 Tax=Araneus ventricosus TaxID=182803 RepID=A0A4Y2FMS9_ARAVE|nr:hypothetical protein AVEN_92005-1 [Araneus ventricosus]